MGVGTLLTRVPWKQVITMLPTIVQTARGLVKASRRVSIVPVEAADSPRGLALRVEELEENERIQAELVKKMAEQQQGLAEGLEFMAARITALIWLAAIALILSLTAFIIVLLK